MFWGVCVFLVDDNAMVAKFYATGKSKHTCEYLAPQIPRQELELLVGMNYRTGVETEVCDAYSCHVAIKGIGMGLD